MPLHPDSKLLTANCKGTKQKWCCSHGSQTLSKAENELLCGAKEAFFPFPRALGRWHVTTCLWPWVLCGFPPLTYWVWHILFSGLIFNASSHATSTAELSQALPSCSFFCAHRTLSVPILHHIAQLGMLPLCLLH